MSQVPTYSKNMLIKFLKIKVKFIINTEKGNGKFGESIINWKVYMRDY
jgi:hypothetical protein